MAGSGGVVWCSVVVVWYGEAVGDSGVVVRL